MIISIFASIGAQNLGDELILKNEIKILEGEYGRDIQFFVFSYDPKNTFYKKSNIKYIEYFPIGIKNPKNIFRNMKNFFSFLSLVRKSDLIVVGGGGIIYDMEKQKVKDPLDSWLFRISFFRFFNKKVIFFSIGLNIKNQLNLSKVKKIFSGAHRITVRDNYSFKLLDKLGIKSLIVHDPVFNDTEKPGEKSYMIKRVKSEDFSYKDLEGIELDGKKIAIAFRKGYLDTDQSLENKKIKDLISFVLSKGAEVILLPHSFHKTDILANDEKFLRNFLRINQKVRIVSSMEDVYEKYIYREFDICLAMRLHSIILSQVYEIPFIGVSYSIKTDEVLEKI